MNYPEISFLINFHSWIFGISIVISLFVITILIICIYILAYLYIVNKRESKFDRWKFISDTLIRKSIFFEEDESASSGNLLLKVLEVNTFPIPDRVKKLLQNSHFKHVLITDLIAARQNMTGAAGQNLKNLFKQLELDKEVILMIKSNSWYLKAAGIQYLGVMEMVEHMNLILPYINNERGLIRVEAQNTVVKFSGFEGLRFLDSAAFLITEWQQIKLLEELSQLPGENFTGIDKWLKSSNYSVVIFALKLARNYFRFELYDNVISCLRHKNDEVRRQAILAAKELQTAATASDLIKFYGLENEKNKLAIIKVLEDVGTDAEFSFLTAILDEASNQLKMAAAKAIAAIGDNGMETLESYPNADRYPYNQIISQVKAEMK